MLAFGSPSVINPFDTFGDHLRLALRAPASFQLLTWLESGPGAEPPPRARAPRDGRWVVCGYGRFGRETTKDLRAEGLDVTVIDLEEHDDEQVVVGDGSDPAVMAHADLANAVGFVAGTDNDTTNLSLVAAARRISGGLFVAARQNLPASAPLFAAMDVDALLVPTEEVAHEVYAQLSTPLLWRFVQDMPAKGDAWAAEVIDRLTGLCGRRLEALWKIRLTEREAPALQPWLATGDARLGTLLRNPDERDARLHVVTLLAMQGERCTLAPDDDLVLRRDDELLLVGRPSARLSLERTLVVAAVREYIVTGRHVPASWIWRMLSRSKR
jgi:voltage-gated potassium channel